MNKTRPIYESSISAAMTKRPEQLKAAVALVRAAEAEGLRLRLLGGLAVALSCPSAATAPYLRGFSDLDCVSLDRPDRLEAFCQSQGWLPDAEFNMYNGQKRLLFHWPDGHYGALSKLDLFVGGFEMCHRFRFDQRWPEQGPSLYPADLLLTKLQIHELNAKDLLDAACLLHDHEPCSDDSGINLDYLARLCAEDWGLWKTLSQNLGRLRHWAARELGGCADLGGIDQRISQLLQRLEQEPKSLRWRSRSLLGTRLRWYEIVEEVER